MGRSCAWLWRLTGSWRHDSRGGVLVVFAVCLPVVVAAVSLAVDYNRSVQAQDQMQAAADAAALAAARELSLANSKQSGIASVVEAVAGNFVDAAADGELWAKELTKKTSLDEDALIVRVTLASKVPVALGLLAGQTEWEVTAASEARVLGQPNICVLGLDDSAVGTIALEKKADVLGDGCAVFSNSSHTNGIKSKNSSTLTASLICTAGGKDGGPGNFMPEPLTDCPQFEDPLADRPEPAVSADCEANGLVVSGTSETLKPGTYCGGLRIEGAAEVTLERGIFVFKDGPLAVGGGAVLKGDGVGLFFSGAGAVLAVDSDSTVSLEAALDGPMAGLLMFEARTQPTNAKHVLLADDAQTMVGTIYLPRGELSIGGSAEVGTSSAYTAIVARKLTLTEGPRIVLHTDYDKTEVPVPDGIKGTRTPVALVK